MSDIFVSYARSTRPAALQVAAALRALGYGVWLDDQLPAHRAYADVIAERLREAMAVVVVWSADAAKSQWVRAEADVARNDGKLVQFSLDGAPLPLPFNQIQCVELRDWSGDTDAPGWRTVIESIAALGGKSVHAARPPAAPHAPVAAARPNLLAVLAFDNLSNDPELSYFSDGVSEEILYTIARAKGLRVIGKASSFNLRGADKTGQKVAGALGATHMLDGSVRRSGDNIRIRVELVDTASLETLWSERYDRALTDIFALQDEIAAATAAALNHHFAPARTIRQIDPVAYDLYLQAAAIFSQDMTWADQAKCASLLESAVSRAPDFAAAWGRLAAYRTGEAAVAAAQRGLNLDPHCAPSLASLARTRPSFAEHADKLNLAARAYLLAPDDQMVSGVYAQVLMSLGLLSRAAEVADERFLRDPLSPQIASSRAIFYRYAGRLAESAALADRALTDFPGSEYAMFIRGAIAIYNDDLDRAEAVAAMMTSPSVQSLHPPIRFMRAMAALDPVTRSAQVKQFLNRASPKTFLLEVGLACAVGEVDAAVEHLLDCIRTGRPLTFTANNDGRDPAGATVTVGLFAPIFKRFRHDARFAHVCVALGLFDCWQATGELPDCVAEVAADYDLMAECKKLAGHVEPYRQKIERPHDEVRDGQ